MKALAAFVAGLLLATVGVAGAAPQTSIVTHGIWCKTGSGGVLCVRLDGHGYGVGYSRTAVLVMNVDTKRNVFTRRQP